MRERYGTPHPAAQLRDNAAMPPHQLPADQVAAAQGGAEARSERT
jgi:hypothetical protein